MRIRQGRSSWTALLARLRLDTFVGGGEFDVAETVVVRKLRGGVSVSIGSSYLANGCGGKRTNKERGYRVEHTGRGTHPVAIAIAGDAARYGR